MDTTSDVKQCPFCGRDMWSYKAFHIVDGNEEHDEFFVYCTNCGAQGPNELSRTGATKTWNMRRKSTPKVPK